LRYWRKPLDADQIEVPRGEVHILAERCKGCGFCVEYCPRDVIVMSEGFNAKGYHPPKVVRAEECVNCGLCEMICPDYAIFSVLAEKAAQEDAAAGAVLPGHPA